MATVRFGALSGPACAAVLLLAGCAHEGQDQMSWARAALERNSQLEVVAADPQSHTFTVRVKESGELRVVRADQVMAEPLVSGPAAAAPPPAAPAAPQALSADSNTPSAGSPAAPADEAPAAADESVDARTAAAPANPAGGGLLKSGPGYSIQAASSAAPAVMQSGPGYSIKAAPASPAAAGSSARLRDAGVTSAVVERRREPIVCQGARMLHIDNRNLEFDGDAVSAEDGCEIHITNSHISATGVGVLARHANVHIDNSLIEGDGGSIDASEGAQVYAASSHFRGLSRRLDSATFHDLGGNIWN
jgi:hypothetical protein